jgi:hypothetical protein
MLAVPDDRARAAFPSDFVPRVLLTVDTEEEFDWRAAFRRDGHTLAHVPQIARFQAFCERLGITPVYLVDWPIANDAAAVEIIGDAVRRGTAEVGLQLHPWVNPPFDEEVNQHNSFAGNLPRALEAAKFNALFEAIERGFATRPMIYRAGRYGLGPHTLDLLKHAGIAVDTSIRPHFDYSNEAGPDYSRHPIIPYWTDADRSLLELPLTTVYWGLLRQLGPVLQRAQRFIPTLYSAFSRLRLLERIALTPEGVTAQEAIRGIDIALDEGCPVLVLSFHSPTLAPGFTPYAKTQDAVEAVYDWFETVYAYLAARGVRPASVADILAAAS